MTDPFRLTVTRARPPSARYTSPLLIMEEGKEVKPKTVTGALHAGRHRPPGRGDQVFGPEERKVGRKISHSSHIERR